MRQCDNPKNSALIIRSIELINELHQMNKQISEQKNIRVIKYIEI